MKKLLIILILIISNNISAQNQQQQQQNQQRQQYQEPITLTFEQAVTPYIEKWLPTIDNGVELVMEEIPIVIKEWIMFEVIYHWLLISLGVVLILLGSILFIWEKYHDDGDIKWVYFFVGHILGYMFVFINLMAAIKITWFPKLYLLQEFIHLIKF